MVRCLSVCVVAVCTLTTGLPAQEIEPKAARSDVNMRDLRTFISRELSTTYSYGSLRKVGTETRVVRGRVVDHNGRPVSDAQVAFCTDIGYSHRCYDENFDVTDDLGRFLVEGDITRSRVVVRRGEGQCWNVPVAALQNDLEIQWPKPARCGVRVNKEFLQGAIGTPLSLISTEYWVGMAARRQTADVDDEGRAVFENVLPGEYSVCIRQHLAITIGEETTQLPARDVEIARVTLKPGDHQQLEAQSTGKRVLSGSIETKEPVIVQVRRQKTAYEQVTQLVDYLTTDAAGQFSTRPLPPGKYVVRLQLHRPPKPRPAARTFRTRITPNDVLGKFRVEIPELDEPVNVKWPIKEPTVADRIQQVFDSSGQQLNVTWSYADVQAAMVEKGSEATRVLVGIIQDPSSPESWRRLALQAMQKRLESSEIVEELLTTLGSSKDRKIQAGIISTFRSGKHHQDRIVEAILPFASDESFRMRYAAGSTLATLITDATRKRVIGALIDGLSDPYEARRVDSAAWLGRLEASSALPELKRLQKEDPVGRVRVTAAYAVWKLTGESDPAVRLMTFRLRQEDYSGQWESAYYLSQFDSLPDITVKALLAKAAVTVKGPYNTVDKYEQNRVQRTALSTLNKVAPDALPEKLRKKQRLP